MDRGARGGTGSLRSANFDVTAEAFTAALVFRRPAVPPCIPHEAAEADATRSAWGRRRIFEDKRRGLRCKRKGEV